MCMKFIHYLLLIISTTLVPFSLQDSVSTSRACASIGKYYAQGCSGLTASLLGERWQSKCFVKWNLLVLLVQGAIAECDKTSTGSDFLAQITIRRLDYYLIYFALRSGCVRWSHRALLLQPFVPSTQANSYTRGAYIGANNRYSGVSPGEIVGFSGHVAVYIGYSGCQCNFVDVPGPKANGRCLKGGYGLQSVYKYYY